MSEKKVDIEKLIESYMEFGSYSSDILDDMLKVHGYDPLALGKRGVQRIKKLIFMNQVAVKKESLVTLYNKAILLVSNATSDTKESIINLLKQKSPSLQFRNLETLDEENLQQILTETEILELIDKLEKGEIE